MPQQYHSQMEIEQEMSRLMEEGNSLLDALVEAREKADRSAFEQERKVNDFKEAEANAYLVSRERGKTVEDSKRFSIISNKVMEAKEQVLVSEAVHSTFERKVVELKERHRWVEKKIDALRTIAVNYRAVVGSN